MNVKELIEALKECDSESIPTISIYDKAFDKYERIEITDLVECLDETGKRKIIIFMG